MIYAAFVVAFSLKIRQSLDSARARAAAKALLLHAAYALLLAFLQANPKIRGIEHNAEGAVHIFLARGALLLVWLTTLATTEHSTGRWEATRWRPTRWPLS